MKIQLTLHVGIGNADDALVVGQLDLEIVGNGNDPARDSLELAVDKDGIALMQIKAVVIIGVAFVDIGKADIYQRGFRLDLGF